MSLTGSVVLVGLIVLVDAQALIRSNVLHFKGLRTVTWKESSHVVTSGQPYNGVLSGLQGKDYLLFKSGRKGSAVVAGAFNDGLHGESDGDAHVMGLKAHGDHRPRELNFMSAGELTVEFPDGRSSSCQDMRIGQGHAGAENNWWIGGENCVKRRDAFVAGLVCCGLAITPSSYASVDNIFEVAAVAQAQSPIKATAELTVTGDVAGKTYSEFQQPVPSVGTITFEQTDADTLKISYKIRGVGETGKVRLLLSDSAATGEFCKEAGLSYTPLGKKDLAPKQKKEGDRLVESVFEGELVEKGLTLTGEKSVIGRSIAVFRGPETLYSGPKRDLKDPKWLRGQLACAKIRLAETALV